MRAASSGSFRAFALEFYAAPGVEAAALSLQDEAGEDVILSFYGIWRAERGESLGPQEAREAARAATEWAERVVGPLRRIRREMKRPFADVPPEEAEAARREVKALELEMELRLIARLGDLAALEAGAEPAGDLALGNLAALSAAAGRQTPLTAFAPLIGLWSVWRGIP